MARAASKKPIKIGHMAMARASEKPGAAVRPNPFVPPAHPKVPADKSIAMDQSTTDILAWAAAQVISTAFYEGTTFLGYAYLSELAQRAEYRRISETIASEMTRKWIRFVGVGDEDKTDKIKRIEAAFKRYDVQGTCRKVIELDGYFGRSHIFLDFSKDGKPEPGELKTNIGDGWNAATKAKVKKGSLGRLKVVEPVWCYPTGYNSSDPLSSDWFKPQSWFVQGKEVHTSRILTFVGREVPDMLKPAYSFGGLSMSQMAKPYIDNWLRTRQSVADIVHSFSVFGLKTNLESTMGAGGDELFQRADFFNKMRDNRGLMIIDKSEEDFFIDAAPLSSLDNLQAQAQEHMGAVSGIPIVKLLGIQPAGLNATSEGEIKVFYDWIASNQEKFLRKNLQAILGFVMMSEFGEADEEISFEFNPLEEMNEKELAELEKIRAETDSIYLGDGTISPEESRTRIAGDTASPYHGLDPDDVPEPPEEEEPDDFGGGEPKKENDE